MPYYKVKYVFAYPGYGWQEIFYQSTAIDLQTCLKIAMSVTDSRTAIMNANTVLEEVQVSQEPDPAWDENVDFTAAALTPFMVRGDSLVATPTRSGMIPVGNNFQPGGDLDPWLCAQFTLLATPNPANPGPYYRRPTYLRGLDKNFLKDVSGTNPVWMDAFTAALATYVNALSTAPLYIRGAQKNATFVPITAVGVGPQSNTYELTVAAAIPGLVPGLSLTVKGFTRGVPGLNGTHRIVAVRGNNPIIASTLNQVFTADENTACALRRVTYSRILPVQAGATLTAGEQPKPNPRLRKHKTGRDLWTSRGQKKRRPSATP